MYTDPMPGAKMEILVKIRFALVGVLPLLAAAQNSPPTEPQFKFDVASVKVSPQPYLVILPKRSGGHLAWTTDLTYLLTYAFRLQAWQISGPIPGSRNIYAVDAVTDPNATDDQVRLMFQSLLIDRFKLEAHHVSKDVEGFALTVAKNGPRIPAAKDGDQPAEMPEWFRKNVASADLEGKVVSTVPAPAVVAVTGRRVTMLQFSEALQRVLRLPVLDQTGLTAKYYFAVQFAQPDHTDDANMPDLATAIQDLGLKLVKHKGPVEMLVVDRIETVPTEN